MRLLGAVLHRRYDVLLLIGWAGLVLAGCKSRGGSPEFKQIHAHKESTCGVMKSGELLCWGKIDQSVVPSGSFEYVSTGAECAIRTDGTVECWGLPDPSGEFEQLAETRACGITESGDLECWTDADADVLDQSPDASDTGTREYDTGETTRDGEAPRPDDAGETAPAGEMPRRIEGPFVDISDEWPLCAVRKSGALECWGSLRAPPRKFL